MYVRIRAISSRVNKNHDGWPSTELAGGSDILNAHKHSGTGFTVEAKDGNKKRGFASFVGKPIFVDHNNTNPKRGRGVIVDSKFRVLDQHTASQDDYWKSSDVDPEHLPASEIELLLEVDAKQYPKFAKAIKDGHLDGFSMGANVEYTKCSHCGNEAHDPAEFCSHVLMKGAHHDYKTADGKRISRKSYENCYGCGFFEISGVFDPADETALAREVRASVEKESIAIDPYSDSDEGITVPDPARPNDEAQLNDKAMEYHMQGVPWEDSVEMARNNLMKHWGPKQTLPGASDGQVYTPKRLEFYRGQPGDPEFDANGMPGRGGLEGFPPPIYPNQVLAPDQNAAFHSDAQDALNEQWPHRPVQNDPRWSAVLKDPARLAFERLAENPLPQEMMTKAPDEVDTLRQEQTCPVCGADMDSEQCKVCGYTKPPKEFDNPDLQEAQKVRDEMKAQDEAQADPSQDPSAPPAPQSPPPSTGGPGGPLTSKPPMTASVTNDMRWTPKVHARVAARINQIERPVGPAGSQTTNEPKDAVVLSDQTKPVTSAVTPAMRTARQLIAAAQKNNGETMNTRTADGPTPPGDTAADKRVDVTGVGGIDQASNEEASKADAQVDVVGVGGTGVSDVSPDSTESLPTAGESSDDSGFNTDKTTEDSGPTKTFDDSDGSHSGVGDPVTSETPYWVDESKWSRVILHSDDNDAPFVQQEQQGGSVNDLTKTPSKGTEPADPVGKADERVDLYERVNSPENNSGPTKTWSGTDGNGVTKQVDPVTHEDQEWGGVKVPDVTLHTNSKTRFINAGRLVDSELELGLYSQDEKYAKLAEYMDADPRVVATKIQTLAQVKVAGQKVAAQHKLATRVPRAFGSKTTANHDFQRIASEEEKKETVDDSLLDSALFGR